jgi:hypothetical protein
LQVLGYNSAQDTYDRVLAALTTLFTCVTQNASDGGARQLLAQHGLIDAHDIAGKLARALLVIKAASYVAVTADLISIGVIGDVDNDIEMRFEATPPPPPLPDGQPTDGGLPAGGDSLPPNVILKRTGSTVSYWLDSERQAHHIPNGDTYLCLANVMPAWFDVDDDEFNSVVNATGDDAACGVAAPRSLAPEHGVKHVFMRRDDGAGDETWYYIRDDGIKVLALDGRPTCRFDDVLVWDYVSDIELSRFSSTPSDVARTYCP